LLNFLESWELGDQPMPQASDFRTVRVQASLFTPELQFRPSKLLAYLLTKYSEQFDGTPVVMPAVQEVPPDVPQVILEMPQIILKSTNGKLRLHASRIRLDVMKEDADQIEDATVVSFLDWMIDLGLDYLTETKAKAGRIACIVARVVDDATPGITLSRHFCQEQWVNGPLNRPGDFELHAHKRFRLNDLFEINSWFRTKTALKRAPAGTVTPAILVEQDFNTLVEQMEARELTAPEIRKFFELAPAELRRVLELYFPNS
jgi:hypothetical protein